jgi:hypothetical protein
MKPSDRVLKIFHSVSVPLLLIDRNYVVIEANDAAVAHLGRVGGKVVGDSCFRMTHDLNSPCWNSGEIVCPVKGAFATGKRVRAIHKHRIDDHLVVEEIVATPIDEGKGDIAYVVEELRDLTEMLELNEGILPICAGCKKIRDEKGNWRHIEAYIHDHTGADFSHSLCPECFGENSAK